MLRLFDWLALCPELAGGHDSVYCVHVRDTEMELFITETKKLTWKRVEIPPVAPSDF